MKKIPKKGKFNKTSHKKRQNDQTFPSFFTKVKTDDKEASQQFASIIQGILLTQFFNYSGRHTKIKLENWLQALSKPQFNLAWKANKLNYLKLLLLMCQCELIIRPFNSFPRQTSIPVLQKHQINQIIDEIEKQVKSMGNKAKKRKQNASIRCNQSLKSINNPSKQDLTKVFSSKLSRTKTYLTVDENKIINKGQITQKNKQIYGGRPNSNTILKPIDSSKNTFIQKIDDQETKYRKTLSISKALNNHALMIKQTEQNSLVDSLDLFNPRSVSSQIWSLTHKQKEKRSQTIDIRNLGKRKMSNSQHSFQSNHHHLTYLALEIDSNNNATTNKKQYWESNSLTGNATPKYLHNIREATCIAPNEDVEIVTYRSSEKSYCDCVKTLWNNGR